MSYRINHYNGTLIAVVNDGTVNNTLDLTLVGKNYAGYGAIQNDNFVYLLENFANVTPPMAPISGQIWFDSGNRKLKFYDGSKFRTTGGAEIGTAEPTGLTIGDFWWDTANNQLHAYTGNGFTLIGPQIVAGSGATEMLTTTVKDTLGGVHSIIQAISGGEVVFVISSDSTYILDDTLNAISGFSTIKKGVTLAYTNSSDLTGVTTSDDRFWGTASNADKLGGIDVANFVQSGDASFDTTVNFADVGYTIGKPTPKLKVFNSASTTPTISNIWNDVIDFTTTVNSTTTRVMQLKGADILPGTPNTTNLGSSSAAFGTLYASTFTGTAAKSQLLRIGTSSNYAASDAYATPSTIVVRDSSADIYAHFFQGRATTAQYADLAEKYLADAEYEVGTVMCVGGEAEVTAATFGSSAIGVVSNKPAYLMNKDLVGGTIIALKGRVPVKIIGSVKKGDFLIASGAGYGRADNEGAGPRQFGVALESNDAKEIKLVECLIL
jgi:hypothetical protein